MHFKYVSNPSFFLVFWMKLFELRFIKLWDFELTSYFSLERRFRRVLKLPDSRNSEVFSEPGDFFESYLFRFIPIIYSPTGFSLLFNLENSFNNDLRILFLTGICFLNLRFPLLSLVSRSFVTLSKLIYLISSWY